MRWIAKVLSLCIVLLLVGCRSIDRKTTITGLFGDKLDVLLSAYSKIEAGVTTQEDLEKAGFNFLAPNVRNLMGSDALQYLFGPGFSKLRETITVRQTKEDAEIFLSMIDAYRMYFIPFKDVTKTKDRFWWSTKEETQKGLQVEIVLLFNKNNVVVYKALSQQKLDVVKRTYGFLHGILRFVFMDKPEEAFDDLTDSNREDEEGLGLGLLGKSGKDKEKDKDKKKD